MDRRNEVTVRETTLVIPTYYLKKDNPNPPWHKYMNFRVYPYSLHDNVSRTAADLKYKAVIIENRYLRLTVLPDRGGHIYSAFDKRNRKELFYVDKVLKPSLFACRGAWNYGGVEFNFPIAHNPNTLDRVMYTVQEEADGSRGIVFGNIERLSRMSWQVGLFLHPRSSAVEQRVLLFNRSTLPAPYYFWTDAALNATPSLQFVYPMKYFSLHGTENIYHRWPFRHGSDYRLLRNIHEDISIFAGDSTERYYGAYDPASRCAVIHLSDGTPQGKKLWTAGKCERGDAFAREFDVPPQRRPLVEMQCGLFQTQNHFEILHPGQSVSWKEWWLQAIDLDNLIFSSPAASVGGEISGRRLSLQLSAIKSLNGTLSVFSGENGKKQLFREKISVTPEKTFKRNMDLPSLSTGKLLLELKAEDGATLLSCPWPRSGDSPAAPESRVVENGKEEVPSGYTYSILNDLEKPVLKMKAGLFAEAGTLLENLPNSSCPASAFYGALACFKQGLLSKALSRLNKVGRKNQWTNEAAKLKIKILLRKKNFKEAFSLARTLPARLHAIDPQACALAAAAMRKGGDPSGSLKLAGKILDKFPLHLFLLTELVFAARELGRRQEEGKYLELLNNHLGGEMFLRHELMLEYGSLGLWGEIAGLPAFSPAPSDPILECLRAYALNQSGETGAAMEILDHIEAMSFDYVFPSQPELFEIFSWALKRRPKNAGLHYALGNLCYAGGRYKEAQKQWETAFKNGSRHSVLFRNLALIYGEINGDSQKAINMLEKGLDARPPNGFIFMYLDNYYRKAGLADKRRNLLKYQGRFPDKDYIIRSVINIHIDLGQLDEAVRLVHGYDFTNWEADGNEEIAPELSLHAIFYNAHIKRGLHFIETGKPEKALADFNALLHYPENFPTARNEGYFAGDIFFYQGLALEKMGKSKEAYACFVKALKEEHKLSDQDQKKYAELGQEKLLDLAQEKVLAYARLNPDAV